MIRDKRGKSLIIAIIIIVLLVGLSFLVFREGPKLVGMAGKVILEFSNQENFAGGNYATSEYVSGIKLSSGSASGSYTSEIMDAGNIASWNNISWRQELCYQCELPGNGQSDAGDYDVSVDMSGNVLLYHMNEESGNITDYSGMDNGGIPSDSIAYGADGKFNSALSFSEKKRVDAGKGIDFSDAMTVLAWIKPSNCESDSCIVASRWRENGNKRSWSIVVEDGGLRFDSSPDGNWYEGNKAKGGSVSNGGWYFVAGVYDSTNNYAYLNGELVASVDRVSDGILNSDSVGTYIGYSQKWKNEERGFSGEIDEAAIFNRVLSDEEILNIYKRGILNLSLSVRSCDDSLCDGESFSQLSGNSPQTLGLNNHYFQYKFDLSTSDTAYSPLISSVSMNYDLVPIPNNAPVCSQIPDVVFNAGESSSINLADYFSDEDNDSLTYDYSAENVSVSLAENIADISSENNLSGSIIFTGSDGINLTYCNVVYVFVNITLEEENNETENNETNQTGENNETNQTEQNQTQENNETNMTSPPAENPVPSASSASSGGGSGGGRGGGSYSSTTSNVTNTTKKVSIVTENLTTSEVSQANETKEEGIIPSITTNAINAGTPLQRFTSFFKNVSFTTTQAVKNVGSKVFSLKGNSKTGNILAVIILIVLVMGIISFAWFIRKARIQKLPKAKVMKK